MVISVVEKMQDRRTRSQQLRQERERVAMLNRGVTVGLCVRVICEQKPEEDEGASCEHVGEEMG